MAIKTPLLESLCSTLYNPYIELLPKLIKNPTTEEQQIFLKTQMEFIKGLAVERTKALELLKNELEKTYPIDSLASRCYEIILDNTIKHFITYNYISEEIENAHLKHQTLEIISLIVHRQVLKTLRPIGAGASSIVSLSKSPLPTGSLFAVKQFSRSLKGILQAQKESRILRELDHPNIVKVYFCNPDQGYNIYMEYLDGDDIEKALKKANPENTRSIIFQLLNAVAYLHKQGKIHKDLKPENIKVVYEQDPATDELKPRVVLIDFNLSDNIGSTRLAGSQLYIAPEVAGMDYKQTEKVDSWAIGITLLLTFLPDNERQELFPKPDNGTPEDLIIPVLWKLRNPRYLEKLIKSIPSRAIQRLLKKLLITDPDRRFSPSEVLLESYFRPITPGTFTPFLEPGEDQESP